MDSFASALQVIDSSLEVFQAEGPSEGWQTVTAEEVVSIPGNVRHALRNTSPSPINRNHREQAGTLQLLPRARTAIRSEQSSRTANSGGDAASLQPRREYEYWLASPDENAAIGISLR